MKGEWRMNRDLWLGGFVIVAILPSCSVATGGAESDPMDTGSTKQLVAQSESGTELAAPLAVPCEQLIASLQYPNAVFTSATSVPAGELMLAGQPIPAHCLLTGKMNERVGPVDGQAYAIGFEMRLPLAWNNRFFYQANGGLDGIVVPATGDTSGGGPLTSALLQGFTVISSDAGHSALQNPSFGLDPQARLDFGYQAVGKLTKMAKAVILTAFGQTPAYSYIGGCSNGGRHTLVAASRYADQYDGYLVGAPGLDLPKAAVSNIYGAQQYAPLSGGAVIAGGPFAGLPDLSAAYTQAERQLVSNKVLERCDALDGLVDGLIQRTVACQFVFDLDRDLPTCPGARDGTCLTAAQKVAIKHAFAGGQTSSGSPLYARFPFDSGHASGSTAFWDFISPLVLDSGAVGFVFGTPPVNPASFNPVQFALSSNVDQLYASIFATNGTYTEASQSFMVPPNRTNLNRLRARGARMLVYHGSSDPIFSADHTRRWFTNLNQTLLFQSIARLYLVPGMNHCAGGPATDQFDLLSPLVRWVEQGEAPLEVIASARGPANPGGFNFELPSNWAPDRSRPLCPYPLVALYRGGDVERASSFDCSVF
jgi:pimeloyl-ACP methyl ester carboxylesterase